MIEYFDRQHELGLTATRQQLGEASKTNKDDCSYFLSEFPMNHVAKSIGGEFYDIFWNKVYAEYASKYSILQELGPMDLYTVKIQKTQPGQGYHVWHCEHGSREVSSRVLTWTVYLNDDFEAGETEFLYQQYRYKPSKGDCVIFPAAYTHTHRGNPPIGGDKYIITGWVEF